MSKRHNPEKRSWRGRSHKKHGERVSDLRAAEYYDGHSFNACEEHSQCPVHRTGPPTDDQHPWNH